MEEKEGNCFNKIQSKEAEEHGGSAASRVWLKSWFAIKIQTCFLIGHKSAGGLNWQHLAWWGLSDGKAYANFDTSLHP